MKLGVIAGICVVPFCGQPAVSRDSLDALRPQTNGHLHQTWVAVRYHTTGDRVHVPVMSPALFAPAR